MDTMLATIGIVVKEPWAVDISYEMLNYTLYAVEAGGDGCGYIALKDNIGVTPGSDETVWRKAVQAGQSIYDLAVKYHHFVGTEEEFEAQYQAALQAALDAAASATAAEAQVEAAEALRVQAESSRESAETARAAAESARATAEASRETAESSRASAESSRVSAETGRSEAETARQTAETTRQSNETAREGAEASRTQQFEALKADMQVAIGQADAAATAATEAAASAVETEENIEAAEASRVTAEQGRVTAEQGRASAEQGRVSAESARVTAEAARETQAGTDHTRAESDHTQAGTDHTQAAADHTRAESDHSRAESDHTQAAADHTQAGSDHAVVEGYDTRLTNVEGEVSQLGQYTHEKFYEYPGYMQSSGAYSPQAGASFSVIKILPNVKYKITRTSSQAVTFAFLATFDGIPDTSFDLVGSVISLSTDVAEGFVPSTANYIYLMRMYDADVKSLPIIEIDNLTITKPLDAETLDVNRKVEEIYITKKGIQDIPIKVNLGYINLNGEFVTTTGTSWYASDYIAIPGASFVSGFLAGTTSNLSIAFYDGEKNFISGVKSNVNFTPREFNTFAPYNAKYVRVSCYNAAGNVVEDKYTKVFAFYSVDFDTIFRRIMKQKPVNTNTGYLDRNGVFHSTAPYTAWYSSDFLPCYDGCLCNVKANGALNTTLLLAFYDVGKNFISGVAPQVGNTLEEFYINAPTGTCYVRCCTNGDSIASTHLYVQTFPELEPVEDNGIYGVLRFAGNLHQIAFSGKKILFFGDSITKGVCSFAPTQEYPYGLKEITNCYAKLLADYVGASSFENYAISGSSFVDAGNSIKTITTKIQEVSEAADIIYIAGGTNDFQLQTALGTISDTTAASVYGALHVICEYLKTTYPNAEILFATPINWSKAGIVATTKLNDYRNAIFEVATMYGYNVVDCSDIPFPRELSGAGTPAYKEATCYDGIHPTELGHQFMAGNIAKMLL